MNDKKIKFIRKNGKIIPIKDKGNNVAQQKKVAIKKIKKEKQIASRDQKMGRVATMFGALTSTAGLLLKNKNLSKYGTLTMAAGLGVELLAKKSKSNANKQIKTLKKKGRFSYKQFKAIEPTME